MKLYLITCNIQKFDIANYALAKYGIGLEQLAISTPEIQSDDAEKVAKYSVKFAAEKTGKMVIKNDFGMNIPGLNGFPGPFIKYINQWLTADQFSSIYKNISDYSAYFIDALGFCLPGSDPVCFTSYTYGNLILKPQGESQNMVDTLFIPDGYNKTIAEMSKEESIKLWSNDRYAQLSTYLHDEKLI